MSQNYQPGILGENSDYRLYSHIKYLKGIKRTVNKEEGSITERLLFERGEIRLIAKQGSLEAYSVAYRPGKFKETPHIVKVIRRGITPGIAIDNAKSYIMPRLEYLDKIRAIKESRKSVVRSQIRNFPNAVQTQTPEPARDDSLIGDLEVNVLG